MRRREEEKEEGEEEEDGEDEEEAGGEGRGTSEQSWPTVSAATRSHSEASDTPLHKYMYVSQ